MARRVAPAAHLVARLAAAQGERGHDAPPRAARPPAAGGARPALPGLEEDLPWRRDFAPI